MVDPEWVDKLTLESLREVEAGLSAPIDDLVATERLRLESLATWEEYQRTGQSVSNREVMAWLDSWGSEDETERPT